MSAGGATAAGVGAEAGAGGVAGGAAGFVDGVDGVADAPGVAIDSSTAAAITATEHATPMRMRRAKEGSTYRGTGSGLPSTHADQSRIARNGTFASRWT